MTVRLYYDDSYLRQFEAAVTGAAEGGRKVYLDRSAFYPASGGQPCDYGEIGGVRVVDVQEEGDRVAHWVESALSGERVSCRIDWARRFDHMQQHTGQHLLSAVLMELFGYQTVSFHLGEESSTIDIEAESLAADQVRQAERRANQIVFENRPVRVLYADSSSGDLGLRKASDRSGELRIVEIEGCDRSACGGTHVRATGEIGPVLIRKLDKIRGNVRIEFLCGGRAVARARADYEALSRISRSLCVPLDEAPALVETQMERLGAAEKAAKKLAIELAGWQGRELHRETAPDDRGFRVAWRCGLKGALGEECRATAQAFASGGKAIFIASSSDPPSVLLCVSADSGLNAGQIVKAAVASAGGRGGGNSQIAQGSVPSQENLPPVLEFIRTSIVR